MDKNKSFVRNPKIAFHEVGTTTYLLDEKNDEIVTLNETATVLWKTLAKPASSEQLLKKLEAEYILKPTTAMKEIGSFLESLLKRGFILPR
jgi:hypothetical protein